MFSENSYSFALEQFEGPLPLLLHLVQKEEISLYEVAIQRLTAQLLEQLEGSSDINQDAECMEMTATLLLLKSQKLLPQGEALSPEEESCRREIIEKLLEYCQFRETAKLLTAREEAQKIYFSRGMEESFERASHGLEGVTFEELQKVLQGLLAQAPPLKVIQEEPWQVAPKIVWLKELVAVQSKISFLEIFSEGKGRWELIVTFLALLELMKLHEVQVVKEDNLLYVVKV